MRQFSFCISSKIKLTRFLKIKLWIGMCKIALKNAKIFTVSVAVHNSHFIFSILLHDSYFCCNIFSRKVTFKSLGHLDSWFSRIESLHSMKTITVPSYQIISFERLSNHHFGLLNFYTFSYNTFHAFNYKPWRRLRK